MDGIGWAVGWPGGPVISHGGVCAMECRHAIVFSGLSICQGVDWVVGIIIISQPSPAPGPPPAPAPVPVAAPAPVSVCLHHFSGRLGVSAFVAHFVIINLIDLDFNSFILEQLAKMLLTQKVYAQPSRLPIFRHIFHSNILGT